MSYPVSACVDSADAVAIYRSAAGDEAITANYADLKDWLASAGKSEFLRKQAGNNALRHRLRSLGSLRANWDSYGAPPPSEKALANTKRLLEEFLRADRVPSAVVPSAEGGAGLCFIERDRYADVECLNSGEILGAMYRGQENPEIWDVSIEEIPSAIERVRVHFST